MLMQCCTCTPQAQISAGSEAEVDADEGDGRIQSVAECHACECSSLVVSLAAAGLHTQADDVNARFMHDRRGFKPERLSTLVSLSRRGSLLVAVATHSRLPDPAAMLAAPARKADGPDASARDARGTVRNTRRYMTRIMIRRWRGGVATACRVLVSLGGLVFVKLNNT